VRYVLEGSVQKAGHNVRINAQLIDVSSAAHAWAERFEREYKDIFRLQGDLVQGIVAKLAVKTFKYEKARALRKLLSSIYTFQNKYDLAIKEARRAIELNPNDSGSYNELGWAYLWSGRLDEALNVLEMALRLDSSSPCSVAAVLWCISLRFGSKKFPVAGAGKLHIS
jgi:Flp pilus assembly protein TadD